MTTTMTPTTLMPSMPTTMVVLVEWARRRAAAEEEGEEAWEEEVVMTVGGVLLEAEEEAESLEEVALAQHLALDLALAEVSGNRVWDTLEVVEAALLRGVVGEGGEGVVVEVGLEEIPAMVAERSKGSEEGSAVVVEVEAVLGLAGSQWRRTPLEELPMAHS